jgi:hypothetical protein
LTTFPERWLGNITFFLRDLRNRDQAAATAFQAIFEAQETTAGVTSYTATEIADVDHAVNITDKFLGKIVRDDTNKRLMHADGSASADLWYTADGATSVAPA